MSIKKIESIISNLQLLYFFLALFAIVAIPVLYYLGRTPSIEIYIGAFAIVLKFFGLYKLNPWVVPVILFTAAMVIANSILNPIFNIVYMIAICLNIFEIYFFTKKDVQKYFKFKGLMLF